MTETNNEQAQAPLTPEQIKERQDNITKWYKQQIPHLKVQTEYEELQARLSIARYQQAAYDTKFAQLMVSLQQPEEKPADKQAESEQREEQVAPTPEQPARRLKTE